MIKNFVLTLITAVCLFVSPKLFAGNDHYIDVIVSDTVVLKAVHFVYEVSTEKFAEFPDYKGLNTGTDSFDKVVVMDQLRSDLQNAGFTVKTEEKDNFDKTENVKPVQSLLVDCKNKAELERLYNLITPMNHVYGNLKSVEYESPDPYYNAMFKSLYNKAVNEAGMLAKMSGGSISKVLSITEVKDQDGYYDEMMKLFSKSKIFNWLLNSNSIITKNYIRKFTFRFELNS